MVTKLELTHIGHFTSFVLAKKLMVTKRRILHCDVLLCFVLAKKLMVTKPQIHITINLRFYKM